jgi:hypothetical protein
MPISSIINFSFVVLYVTTKAIVTSLLIVVKPLANSTPGGEYPQITLSAVIKSGFLPERLSKDQCLFSMVLPSANLPIKRESASRACP